MRDNSLSPKKIDRTDIVQELWSLDGPHTAEAVVDAAGAIAQLWRYLARVTLHSDSQALADPADVYLAIGNLKAAAYSAGQVLGQFERWAFQLAHKPGLTHDADRDNWDLAVEAASTTAFALEDAFGDMGMLARHLSEAAAALGHLYIDSDADLEGEPS